NLSVLDCVLSSAHCQSGGMGFVALHPGQRRRAALTVKRLARVRVYFRRFQQDAVPGIHAGPTINSIQKPALIFIPSGELLGYLGGSLLGLPVWRYESSDSGDDDGHAQLALE